MPDATASGRSAERIEWVTEWFAYAVGVRSASKPALKRKADIGRKRPWRVSASRDQISCTGRFSSLPMSSASRIQSGLERRPKPPPKKQLCGWMSSAGSPVTAAPTAMAPSGFCIPAQMSARCSCTCTVQFSGSMHEWAK